MTITIKIKTENAAFCGEFPQSHETSSDAKHVEIARILTQLADDWPYQHEAIQDHNGNTVGSVTVRGK